MNRGKVGRPYQAPNTYILFLATVRFIFDIKYRQLEGFTRKPHQLIPKIRPMGYSGIRKRIVELKARPRQKPKGYERTDNNSGRQQRREGL